MCLSLNQTLLTFLLYLDDSIDLGNSCVRSYLPLIQIDPSMHGLAVYVKEGLLLHETYRKKTPQILTYVFDWLYFTQCITPFFLYWSPSLSFWMVFDSILSNIDAVLLINPSANVFVFRDFNIHHKDSLTYSGRADRYCELCYSFSLSNDLTQMVSFPTQIPDYDSHSPALLDSFISSDASICSIMAFPPLGNSDHVVVSVSLDFPSFTMGLPNSLHFLWLFSCWLGLSLWSLERWSMGGYLQTHSVLLLLLVIFVSRFRLELMYISLTKSIR